MKPKRPKFTEAQIIEIIVGMITFAALMGIQGEFHSIWARALIAGCAGAVAGIVIVRLMRPKE